MASLTPAERAGVADEVGSLEAGKRADLLVLSRQLDVLAVLIDGVTVVGTTDTCRGEASMMIAP